MSKEKITKSRLIAAMDDILTIFDFDDTPDMETTKIAGIVEFLNEKQDGDDAFQEEDFTVDDEGKAAGLTVDTVRTLIDAGVTVPEGWTEMLKKVGKKAEPVVAKKAAKSKKAADPEEQYEEEVKKARKEDEKDAKKKKVVLPPVDEDEDENPAPEKGDKGAGAAVKKDKAAVKPAKKTETKPRGDRAARVEVYHRMFTKGGVTRQQVIDAVIEAVPGTSTATIKTEISDFKNPKYNKLPELVVEKEGKLSY